MATHSRILAWRTPWTEEPDMLHHPWGHKRVGHAWAHTQPLLRSHCAPGIAKLSSQQPALKSRYPSCLHLTEEETGAQRGGVSDPRSHSSHASESELEPRPAQS